MGVPRGTLMPLGPGQAAAPWPAANAAAAFC
ncbi:hypothetical protein CBM2589_B30330 [Cupriavidus taiwanensis]|uniref:Uncharacterized protein n=1 Tax=Cupriavidus taiwanensis TaxID=164546 RepID=A0A375BV95_9BURK|nr:hypothetical protein CBM2589_B30330 [Cupriavidus taiwanensis]